HVMVRTASTSTTAVLRFSGSGASPTRPPSSSARPNSDLRRPAPDSPSSERMDNRRDLPAAVATAATVFLFFLPTVAFPFLNWDDGEIFVRNTAWHAPGFLRWAFTTTYLEHFQPGAWLVWGAVDRVWTLRPAGAHAINV